MRICALSSSTTVDAEASGRKASQPRAHRAPKPARKQATITDKYSRNCNAC